MLFACDFSVIFVYDIFVISRKMYEKIRDLPLGRVDKSYMLVKIDACKAWFSKGLLSIRSQGSLVTQGSYHFVTSDRCVKIETVLFCLLAIVALPAILAFEIEKLSIPAITAILALKGSRLNVNFSDQGLSFKRYFFVIFYRHCENWILVPNF